MSQALYRKWRPSTWDQVVGQQHVVQTLRNAFVAGRGGHAYLFAGPRGTGKTSVARILAKTVNCLNEDLAARPCDACEHCQSVNNGAFLDLIEIDAASNTSVEDVRSLRDKINFSPNQGQYKVYIIDEVHMLSTAAFNALLKTLEEPPPHAIFVLATTEVHKIPATVLSRCQRHEFRRISVNDIVTQLENIAAGAGINIGKDALALVARQATGSMRDAISLLDQLSATGDQITLAMAQNVLGTVTSQSVLDVIGALLDGDPATGLDHIHAALDAGGDPRQFARQIVDYLRHVLLVRMGNADQVDTTREVLAAMAEHAKAFTGSELLRVIKVFNQAALESRGAWQPSLPLELALVEALEGPAPAAAPQSAPPAKAAKKSAPPPAAAKPASQAAPAQGGANEMTAKQWKDLLEAVKADDPTTTGLLNSVRFRQYANGVLTLGFASELLKEKMSQPEHVQAVQAKAAKILGQTIEVRCMIAAGGKNQLPPEVDSSGMVATAMRLGGEIVDTNDLGNE